MRNIKKQLVVVVGILATCLLPLHAALAAPNGFTRDARESGCIVRQPGSTQFLRGGLRDKRAIGEAVVNAHRLWGATIIDPCLSGQLQNLPAAVYAALAAKHPEKFQPLEDGDQSIVALQQATTDAALNAAPQYHYVEPPLEVLPPGFLLFDAISITDGGRVYGGAYTVSGENRLISHVAVFERGILTVFQEGIANTANEGGTVGGWVTTDPENFFGQAALFRGNKVQLIPRLPGEIHSEVVRINDPGAALIFSVDENFNGTMALYDRGQMTPLDFGLDIPFAFLLSMNNQGIISGTTFIDGLYRGFRFDPRTGLTTLLEPLPTEPHAWAMGINNRGDVIGYSFIFGATERIGVWDAQGKFHTYFVEGTPAFPTISDRLTFNDHNLIVISRVSNPANEEGNCYLVPEPGVRLNLADLVENLPAGEKLDTILQINNHGDMIRLAYQDFFLLERDGTTGGK